jgi:hypothetical protein
MVGDGVFFYKRTDLVSNPDILSACQNLNYEFIMLYDSGIFLAA